jgi:OmpA-OmpF porin, OOP family
MIKQSKKQMFALVAAIASIGLSAPSVFAQAKDVTVDGKGEVPYVIDGRNVVARSGAGLCWRTGYWSPAAAGTTMAGNLPVGCECDSDIIPKDKCQVAAAPAAAPAPAPAPAPAAGPKPTADKIKLSADTLFDFDKAILKPEGKSKLDDLATQAKGIKLEVILAVGHTDRLGSDSYNQKLSERRANAVKTYLVSKGIEPNRIYTEGKGERQPVTGKTCSDKLARKKLIDCLQPDRRVEIELVGTK